MIGLKFLKNRATPAFRIKLKSDYDRIEIQEAVSNAVFASLVKIRL